jgi:hypothetical protein
MSKNGLLPWSAYTPRPAFTARQSCSLDACLAWSWLRSGPPSGRRAAAKPCLCNRPAPWPDSAVDQQEVPPVTTCPLHLPCIAVLSHWAAFGKATQGETTPLRSGSTLAACRMPSGQGQQHGRQGYCSPSAGGAPCCSEPGAGSDRSNSLSYGT